MIPKQAVLRHAYIPFLPQLVSAAELVSNVGVGTP